MAIERAALQHLILIVPFLLSASFATGCKSSQLDLTNRTEEEPAPRLAAKVETADPRTVPQLVSGWWYVEDNAWRWTARRFAVILRRPIGAARAGALLRLNLALPDVIFSRFKEVTLSATIQDKPLAPETYRRPGAALYTRDIPANLLSTPSVRVDFELDKALPPNQADKRELGVIARNVSLETR